MAKIQNFDGFPTFLPR